jgi:beta-lactamase class A
MRAAGAIVMALIFFDPVAVCDGRTEPPVLPLHVADREWHSLYERADETLQVELEEALQRNDRWRSLIEREKMAVGVVDLADPAAPRFAQVNGQTMMYAASLPKIGILLAAYQSFEDGVLEETAAIHQDLVAMIRRSDNSAASRLVDRVGLRRIEQVLLDPRYRLYDFDSGGGIWVGGRYAAGGQRIPDPIKGLTHAATVSQVCRYYYLLANGRMINPDRSQQMLEILSAPELHDKFVSVLEKVVPTERLYRKSGTWDVYYSDSILVWDKSWRRYILASLVKDEQGERILRELVPAVEAILKR